MIAGHYDMTIRQGDTFAESFTFVAAQLTSFTALMQIRDQGRAGNVDMMVK
jgi:hypothetical protein